MGGKWAVALVRVIWGVMADPLAYEKSFISSVIKPHRFVAWKKIQHCGGIVVFQPPV